MNPTESRGHANVKTDAVRAASFSLRGVGNACAAIARGAFAWRARLIVACALVAPTLRAEAGDSASPQRIVTIAPNSAEIICSLGLADRIVGVSKFCQYPAELTGRPRVGGLFDPDLEKIITLHPDLVVLRGRSDAIARLCDKHGIQLFMDRTESLTDVETCILDLGALLDRAEQAESLARRFRVRLEAIRKRVAHRKRPRVLLTVSRQPDRLANILTTGKGTFLDQMIENAGGANAFGHLDMAYPQLSPEAVIARQPDVIIELLPELDLTPALERRIRAQWRALGPIPAVRNGNIWFITDDHCLIPSPRYVEIVEKVSRILHPVDAATKAP